MSQIDSAELRHHPAVGLYGVMSYVVARRRSEIGLRIALGAGRSDVLVLVLRETAVLLAVGMAAGIVCALALGRSASTLLFGLEPHDPVTLLGAASLLAVVAALASYLPARRASRLDPMVALRSE